MYDDRLRGLGITVAQLDMLVTLLSRSEAVRQADLAREMLMERSTVSRNLARLAAQGLVHPTSGASRREQQIRVTARGLQVVTAAEGPWGAAQDAAREHLGPAGVEALELLTQRVGQEA